MSRFFLHFVVVILSYSAYSQTSHHCDIADADAKLHLGEELTVCGKVVQLFKPKYTKGDPIFLNFVSVYPNHSFTAVIWGDTFHNEFSEALVKYYFGKNVAIYGVIKDYQGKPLITIKSKSQIEVLENYDHDPVKITPKK